MGSGRHVIVIGGPHDVRHALKSQPGDIVGIWFNSRRGDKRIEELRQLAERLGVPVARATRQELDEIASGLRHQGVVARCAETAASKAQSLESLLTNLDHDPLILVLDGVQDPHNLGACLRTADGAGVDAVIVPADRACGITSVVSRTAAGAARTMPFYQVSNLRRTLEMLGERGIWMTGAADDADDVIWERDLTGAAALVLGAEGSGLRDLTRRSCDYLVRIPMMGSVESLNVSVAAGVILYEARRQREARVRD